MLHNKNFYILDVEALVLQMVKAQNYAKTIATLSDNDPKKESIAVLYDQILKKPLTEFRAPHGAYGKKIFQQMKLSYVCQFKLDPDKKMGFLGFNPQGADSFMTQEGSNWYKVTVLGLNLEEEEKKEAEKKEKLLARLMDKQVINATAKLLLGLNNSSEEIKKTLAVYGYKHEKNGKNVTSWDPNAFTKESAEKFIETHKKNIWADYVEACAQNTDIVEDHITKAKKTKTKTASEKTGA